jgi:phage tail-like protein
MGARSSDPALSYQFAVEMSADVFGFGFGNFPIPIKGYFGAVSGLDVEWETAEYKSTSVLGFPHSNFVPLRPVYNPITLRRGITSNENFWLWHQLLAFGMKPILRSHITITMFDRAYVPLSQWEIERAWPSKISGPQPVADSNDISIEEMTLVHGGIHRVYMDPFTELFSEAMQLLAP